MFGYGIALVGLFIFKTPEDVMAAYIAQAKRLVGR